jgi:translocation and assembly module TamB
VEALDSALENVQGQIHLNQNVLTFNSFKSTVGGGSLLVNGKVNLFKDHYPNISMQGHLNHAKLRVYPFQFVQVNGDLTLEGDRKPYTVGGKIYVESALSKEKVLNQKRASTLKSLPYGPTLQVQRDNGTAFLKMNVKVTADKGVMIQNDLFRDTEVKGNLTLVNTITSPKMIGRAESLRGKLIFKNHAFNIQSAVADFDNPTALNPGFYMNANTDLNGVKIQLYAAGHLDQYRVELTSNPTMQESEILSLLAVGLTPNDARKMNANDQSAVQQGEATSLLLHSLDFNREIEEKTGFRVQLDESFNPQQGVSAFRPQSQADTTIAPQITIHRKLGDRLSLSAGSTVGGGASKANQVNLDLLINNTMSFSGVLNNYGTGTSTVGGNGSADTLQTNQTSMGFDLKFKKRFK